MLRAPRISHICALLSLGLTCQPAMAGVPTHLEPTTEVGAAKRDRSTSLPAHVWSHVPALRARIGTYLPPHGDADSKIGTHLPPRTSQTTRIGTHLRNSPSNSAPETALVHGARPEQDVIELNYSFTFEVTRMEGPEGGLPCLVEVAGSVFKSNSSQKAIGYFEAAFNSCPSEQPLAPELADNAFGIEAGTVMPAWDGTVTYYLKKGILETTERAWIFPAGPNGELGVLSVADIEGGTGHYEEACGKLITPDGYEDSGSLLGELHYD